MICLLSKHFTTGSQVKVSQAEDDADTLIVNEAISLPRGTKKQVVIVGRVPILREYGHWAPWRGLGPKNGGALFWFLWMGGGSLPTFDGFHQPHLLPTLLHLR